MLKKPLEYRDERGNTLYGFSQTNLDHTNAKLNDISLALKLLIILLIFMIVGLFILIEWAAYNNIITRIIG